MGACNTDSLVAFNSSINTNVQPVNGLRHKSEGTVNGWYLWSGAEIPQDEYDFFNPYMLNI